MTDVHAGHRQRIRDAYLRQGPDALLDHQYLELLLTYAIPRKDTNELAHALLARFGSLAGVVAADKDALLQVPGIGENAALFLAMEGELIRRVSLGSLCHASGREKLTSPLDAARYALIRLSACRYETVMAACLNSRREVTHLESLQKGVLTEAPIYPRRIAELAILQKAHGILLMHNHPSCNPLPSPADTAATEAVRSALSSIGAQLTDHLIVGGAGVYSFAAGLIIDLSGQEPATLTPEEFAAANAAAPKDHRLPALKVMETYGEEG